MDLQLSVIFLSILFCWSTTVSAWSGNVCSRLKCASERVRVCSYSTWRGCCAYKYVWKTKYVRENYCCSGWTDTNRNQVCNKAICNPRCKNGGKCVRPNVCDCPIGRDGPTCEGITCSHLKPCFPGRCDSRSKCTCQTGFTGNTCSVRKVTDKQRSEIWLSRATLSNVARESNMMKWSFVTDSSNPSDPTPDEIWSNQLDYNYLFVEAAAQFDPDLDAPPAYVQKYGFGVVASSVFVSLTKIPRPGEETKSTLEDYPCQETSTGNSGTRSFWNCSVTEKDFIWKIESGDILNITTMFESGGYRNLKDLNRNQRQPYAVQHYNRLPSTKTLLFKFDKTPPSHCAIRKRCSRGENPLDITEDITGEKIQISWNGYEDSLSGMFRYSWEVFKLQPVDLNDRLGEKEPLRPLKIQEVEHDDLRNSLPIEFKPPSPGMYSIILEASDRANNSIYTRRLVLFDDRSRIVVKSPIEFTTSTNPSNTTEAWQNSLTDDIMIKWENSFINEFHVNNKLLNEVLEYPIQFTGTDPDVGSIENFKKKFVRLDDDSGNRTTKQIKNINGIVKFEFECTHNGKMIGRRTSLLQLNKRLEGIKRRDGDAVVVKVVAIDVMGHTEEITRRLYFDSTKPSLQVLRKQSSNTTDMSIPFGTRIGLNGEDVDSGIHEIRWLLERKNTALDAPALIGEGSIQKKTCNREGGNCYCIKSGECFERLFDFDVDHCLFNISKNYLDTATVDVTMEAVNSAGLKDIKRERFSNIRELHGIGYYSSAVDLKVLRNGHNSVRIGWNKTVSCYYLTEFWLRRSDKDKKEKVHRLATFTDVGFLQPDTNYTVEIIAGYGGEMSDPIFLQFTTESAPAASGLSAGGKAGIGIAIIILLAAIILIAAYVFTGGTLVHALLGRRGNFKNEKQLEQAKKRRTLFAGDEDIYIYGIGSGNGVNLPLAHIIDRNSLALQDLIAEGKFAKIYKAGLTTSDDEKKTVAAKLLRENFTEDEQRLMCAKITFMSDLIGEHTNVVNFIGAVVDNDIWGPTMVLEYCEMGTLLTWLQDHKYNVNDDLIERLFQFSLGIVDGMAYLSSLGVVHRRLAARNILLSFVMEPKISGFGPSVVDVTEEDQKERVPIRWVAPECFQSTKNATTKSDVWSYGIVLYEIFSLGGQPYPTLKTADVIPKVRHGHKMNRPELADEFNYNLMLKCWIMEEKNRPTFKELSSEYNRFMMGESNDLDYSNYTYRT